MDEEADRESTIARVQGELMTLSRRGAARAREAYASLSLVDQSLVTYIGANPGCRNVDIAAHFQLNKSTVSRQLASLIGLGLIESRSVEGRGQALTLTAKGSELQRQLSEEVLVALTARFSSWTEDDIRTFGRLLQRFNSGSVDAEAHN
jgi:DNA-binding MarR family transcriptional regulator